MALTINTNVSSLNAQRNLSRSQAAEAASVGRLSSGLRINSAADDAAGLGISEKLRAQIRSVAQAQRNANDGVSMAQVAEGAMNEMAGILTRMRELAVQASNGTLGSVERGYIHTEYTQLRTELDRIGKVTQFNGQNLFAGTASTSFTMQVGIMNSANDRIAMAIKSTGASALGLTGAAADSLSTAALAQAMIATLDTAVQRVSDRRTTLGAVENRLSVTIANLGVQYEKLSAANSRIRDVDVAEESAALTRNQILTQAGVAVLAQANQLPSAALSLLRG